MKCVHLLLWENRTPIYLALLTGLFGLALGGQERIGSVREVYDGTLPLELEVNTFRHIDRVFPSAIVKIGGRVFPLLKAPRQLSDVTFLSAGQQLHLADYVRLNRVTGLLVLKNGQIVLERYGFGNTPQTRWVSFSVVKSITSTLTAAAVQEGLIGSLDDSVTKYLPELRGSGYDGASIRNVLQMASGVRWNEAYTDPSSDRRKMLDLQTAQRPGALLRFMATLPRAARPGTEWNYNTGETYVLGALVRAAVKRPLAQYLSEKIWSSFAMEQEATWWTESPKGIEFGGSGFAATLRDYGRFGEFVLEGGAAGGRQVVPPGWFPEAGQPKRVGDQLVPYGYMWWSEPEGAFRAFGIFGQSIYVNPKWKVVIVVWSAQQKPTGSAVVSDNSFFAGVLQALP
ncbi:MAG: beta-lactamase family protein [Acidobacteriaceae bacterium]|nr:beta-lactamase family protein [Acidobacteriaceae bacterium]